MIESCQIGQFVLPYLFLGAAVVLLGLATLRLIRRHKEQRPQVRDRHMLVAIVSIFFGVVALGFAWLLMPTCPTAVDNDTTKPYDRIGKR